jgi:hypothetical protein
VRWLAVTIVLALAAGLCPRASANGRPVGTSTIKFRQGHEQDIVAGMTFGMIVSHDGGVTWHWMCEDAIGYGGLFDPDYAYSSAGTIFAGTYGGLLANRDGCTFAVSAIGQVSVSTVEHGPDGALYAAASDDTDTKIYRSTDDGVTFPQSATPAGNDASWSSLVVAPSDPTRVYLTGHRFERVCFHGRIEGATCKTPKDCGEPGSGPMPICESVRQFLLFRSSDAGKTWVPMSRTGFQVTLSSELTIVGVSATNPDAIYAHTTYEDAIMQEGLYRSTDAGASWTKVVTTHAPTAYLVRANGDVIYATQNGGAFHSSDAGMTWTELAGAPHINCLAENAAGEVWACTINFTSMGLPHADGYGIMKSTDLATWTPVLKFQDIAGPLSCPAGTVQQDTCVASKPSTWCCLMSQIGVTTTDVDCGGAHACVAPDGPPITMPPKGCCQAGGGTTSLVAGALVGLTLRRRRAKSRSLPVSK